MTDRAVHLRRVLRSPPERVYRAFLQAYLAQLALRVEADQP